MAALVACPPGTDDLTCPAKVAEAEWWNAVLLWGRAHHDRVARLCAFNRVLGMKIEC